ncbi:unnamed protein product [Paramecium sonneborni]|uniref:NACHT domain-containing protein n=1 Tax=Paramecium sonneborni TaxID=65129 RepID=A0A8S1LQK2_9CILI|nr:unnamed protein product [Paramecium sonneborni]
MEVTTCSLNFVKKIWQIIHKDKITQLITFIFKRLSSNRGLCLKMQYELILSCIPPIDFIILANPRQKYRKICHNYFPKKVNIDKVFKSFFKKREFQARNCGVGNEKYSSMINSLQFNYIFGELQKSTRKLNQKFLVSKSKFLIGIPKMIQNNVQLRGGGICNSKGYKVPQLDQKIVKKIEIPDQFLTLLDQQSQRIIQQNLSNFNLNDSLLSIQWFVYNQQHFNSICFDDRAIQTAYNQIEYTIEQFLKVIPIYIKQSGILALNLLHIVNDLFRIIFTYQIKFTTHVFIESKKMQFQVYIEEINIEFEQQKLNVWSTGIEYEIKLIKTVLSHLRTNFNDQVLALSTLYELFSSFVSMKISDQLISKLVTAGKKFLPSLYDQYYDNPLSRYTCYYYFENTRWAIIKTLEQELSVKLTSIELSKVYNQYILNSEDWTIHYCWLNMISDLLSYRPIKQLEISNDYNHLQEDKYIFRLPYNKYEAKITLFQDHCALKSENLINNLKVQGFRHLQQFSEWLLQKNLEQQQINNNQSNKSEMMLWNYYLNFEFKQNNKPKNYFDEFIQTLFCNKMMIKIKLFIQLYEMYKKQMIQSYQDKQDSFQVLQSNSNSTVLLINMEIDNIKQLLRQCLRGFQQIVYLLFLIDQGLNLEVLRIDEFLKLINDSSQESQKKYQKQIEQFSNNYDKLKIFINYDIRKIFKNIIQSQAELMKEICENENQITEYRSNETKIQFQDICFFKQEEKDKLEIANSLTKVISEIQNLKKDALELKNNLEFNNFNNYHFNNKEFIELIQKFYKDNILEFYIQQIDEKKEIINQLAQGDEKIIEDISGKFKLFHFLKSAFKKLLKLHIFQLTLFQGAINSLNINEDRNNHVVQNKMEIFQKEVIQTLQNLLQSPQLKQLFNSQTNEKESSKISKSLEILIQQIGQEQIIIQQNYGQNDENVNKYISSLKDIEIKLLKVKISQNFVKEDFDEISKQISNCLTSQQKSLEKQQIERNKLNKKKLNIDILCKDAEQKLNDLKNQMKKYIKYKDEIQLAKKEQNNINKIQIESMFECYFNDFNKIINQEEQKEYTIFQDKKFNIIYLNKFDQNEEKNYQKVKIYELFQDCQLCNIDIKNEMLTTKIKIDSSFQFILDELENVSKVKIKNSFFDKIKNQIFDRFKSQSYKVRECLLYNLEKIQSKVQEKRIILFCQQLIKEMWISEKNANVRQLLKNKEMIETQKKIFSVDIQQFSNQVENEFKIKIQQIEQLEQQIRLEGKSVEGEQLEKQLNQEFLKFEESFDNISEMSNKLDLSLIFLKEIVKDLKQIKSSIEKLQDTIQIIGNDLRKLRGKKFYELLKIRQKRIIAQRKTYSFDSIYIELITKEYNPETGDEIPTQNQKSFSTLLSEKTEDYDPEINEFLWFDKNKDKDVLLLRGQAGSGKSRAATKIEEVLWYIKEKVKPHWTPIYISLPGLKDPIHNLIAEALSSEYYQFDNNQIKEFKESICNGTLNCVFILDSYDEMKQKFIQENLYTTNKLKSEFNIMEPGKKIKIIITTRNEILTYKGYQKQFQGEHLKYLKEVEIQPFEDEQRDQYIKEYCQLTVKRMVKIFYEQAKLLQGQLSNIDELLKIWEKLNQKVMQKLIVDDQDSILQKMQIEKIIEILKMEPCFQQISEELYEVLRKDLSELWNYQKFKKTIENLQRQELMQTPFMMSIVVQVLPGMINQSYKNQSQLNTFQKNYMKFKLHKLKSIQFQLKQNQQNKDVIEASKSYSQQNQGPQNNFFEEMQEQIKMETDQIIKILEDKKFFQIYSLSDKLEYNQTKIILNNKIEIEIGENVDFVVKVLKMNKKMKVTDFYEYFVQFYHEQQLQKWRDIGKAQNYEGLLVDLQDFSESLALEMTMYQQIQINYKPKGKLSIKKMQNHGLENEWEDQYFNNLLGEQEYNKVLKSCVLLIAKGSAYSFLHKSIQEYFVARYLYRFINEITNQNAKNLDQLLKECLLNNQNFNLSYIQFYGSITLMKIYIENKPTLIKKLITLIQQIKTNKNCIQLISNLMYILSQLQVVIDGVDLQGICLQNTDLGQLNLFKCDLSGSEFLNVRIDACNFNCSILNCVRWYDTICSEIPDINLSQKTIIYVTLSSNNQILACGSNEGELILLNMNNRETIKTFKENSEMIEKIVFSINNNYLAALQNQLIIILNTTQVDNPIKQHLIELARPHRKQSITFTIDSQFLCYNCQHFLFLWDIKKQYQEQIQLNQESKIEQLCYSPDGKWLAIAFQNKFKLLEISELNTVQQDIIQDIEAQQICQLEFAKNGNILFLRDKEFYFQFWDVTIKKNIKLIKRIPVNKYAKAFYFSPNFDYFIQQIPQKDSFDSKKYQFEKLELFRDIKATSKWPIKIKTEIQQFILSPDGNLIYIALTNQIFVYNIQYSTQKEILKKVENNIEIIQLSYDGHFLAIGLKNGNILLWNTIYNKQISIIEESQRITDLKFSKNNKYLSACSNQTSSFWNIEDKSNIISINKFPNRNKNMQQELHISSKDDFIIFLLKQERMLLIYDLLNNIYIDTKLYGINCCDFHPIDGVFAFASLFIEFATVKNGKVKQLYQINLECITFIQFLSNGDYLACINNKSSSLYIFNTRNLKNENCFPLYYFERISSTQGIARLALSTNSFVSIFQLENREFIINNLSEFIMSTQDNLKVFQFNTFAISDQLFVTLVDDNLQFYQLGQLEKVNEIQIEELKFCKKLKFSIDNKYLMGVQESQIILIDIEDMYSTQKYFIKVVGIQDSYFLQNNSIAILLYDVIQIWKSNKQNQKELEFSSLIQSYENIALNSNGKTIALSEDSFLTLTNFDQSRVEFISSYHLKIRNINGICFNKKGEIFIQDEYQGRHIFNKQFTLLSSSKDEKLFNPLDLKKAVIDDPFVYGCQWVSDDVHIVLCNRQDLFLFSKQNLNSPTQTFNGIEGFSIQQNYLVMFDQQKIKIYDISSNIHLNTLQLEVKNLYLSNDTDTLLSCQDNSIIKVFNIKTYKQNNINRNLDKEIINYCNFSLDSQTLFYKTNKGQNILNIYENHIEQLNNDYSILLFSLDRTLVLCKEKRGYVVYDSQFKIISTLNINFNKELDLEYCKLTKEYLFVTGSESWAICIKNNQNNLKQGKWLQIESNFKQSNSETKICVWDDKYSSITIYSLPEMYRIIFNYQINQNKILDVSFSMDDSVIAIGFKERIEFINIETQTLMNIWEEINILQIDFTSNYFIIRNSQQIDFWQRESFNNRLLIKSLDSQNCVKHQVSKDGTHLIQIYASDIKIWKLTNFEMVKELSLNSFCIIKQVIISPDNQKLCVTNTKYKKENVYYFSLYFIYEEYKKFQSDIPNSEIAPCFSNDSRLLFVILDHNIYYLPVLYDCKILKKINHSDLLFEDQNQVQLIEKNSQFEINLISYNQNYLIILKKESNKSTQKYYLTKLEGAIDFTSASQLRIDSHYFSVSEDLKYLLLEDIVNREFQLWDLQKLSLIKQFGEFGYKHHCFSKSSVFLSSLNSYKKDMEIIVLKDLKSKFIKYQNYSQIKSLKFSNEEEILISGHDDGTVRFWNVRMKIQLFLIKTSTTEVSFIDLSPDNLWLAVITDRMHIYKFSKCKLCLNQLLKQQSELEETEKIKNQMSRENSNQRTRNNRQNFLNQLFSSEIEVDIQQLDYDNQQQYLDNQQLDSDNQQQYLDNQQQNLDSQQSDLDNYQQDQDQNINSDIEVNYPICWRTQPFLEFVQAEQCFLFEAEIMDNQGHTLNELFFQKGAVREQERNE